MTWTDIRNQLAEVFSGMVASVIEATPRVLSAIVLLLVMLIAAKIVERVLRFLLSRLKIDKLVAHAGIDQVLKRMGIRQSLERFVPRLAYFLLLLLFAQVAAQTYGLNAISNAIEAAFGYLPNLIAALLLLIVGIAVAQFVGSTIAQAAEESGLEMGATLGQVASALILFVVGVMAASQLRIDTQIIRIVAICLLAALGLAFGLAFGLGSRQATRNVIAGFYVRKLFRVGDSVEVRGLRGTIEAITPAQTVLSDGESTVAVANATLVEGLVRRRAAD